MLKQVTRWWTQRTFTLPAVLSFWYVRAEINLPDGTRQLDSKRNQLWTSREDLLALYERRVGPLTRITPLGEQEPLDAVQYRWYDDEEEHAYRYFWILRCMKADIGAS